MLQMHMLLMKGLVDSPMAPASSKLRRLLQGIFIKASLLPDILMLYALMPNSVSRARKPNRRGNGIVEITGHDNLPRCKVFLLL